jgi:6-phosphogluconolactonase (cycloisomerase 2 family)
MVVLAMAAAALSLPARAHAWASSCCGPWQAPDQVLLSSDGRFAYASAYDVTLAMAREPDTGALKVIDSYDAGGGATAMSPDGTSIYAADFHSESIAAFSRNSQTGLLTVTGRWLRAGTSSPFKDLQVGRDGRHVYATDQYRDAIAILARDPSTGALSLQAEVRSGDPGVEGLVSPTGLALSDDGHFLYVGSGAYPFPVLVFSIGGDGTLSQIQSEDCGCGLGDIELSADGKRLWSDQWPVVVERDPASGLLGASRKGAVAIEGGDSWDGVIAVSADGSGAYGVDRRQNRIYQFADGASAPSVVATYRQSVDGPIRSPRGAVLSADGRFLYVPSGDDPTQNEAARIAVFKRDPNSGGLKFASLFTGPFMDGRPPSEQLPLSVQINGGDQYTNDPDVELTIEHVNPGLSDGILVSNDGGFPASASTRFDYDRASDKYPWTLASSGPERLAKTVYVRSPTWSTETATDSIILDERPPSVDSAVVAKRKLTVRAHDNLSGVARMQVTRNRSKPGAWRVYRRTVRLPKSGTRYVRVRDRARNSSHWRRAAVRRR